MQRRLYEKTLFLHGTGHCLDGVLADLRSLLILTIWKPNYIGSPAGLSESIEKAPQIIQTGACWTQLCNASCGMLWHVQALASAAAIRRWLITASNPGLAAYENRWKRKAPAWLSVVCSLLCRPSLACRVHHDASRQKAADNLIA